MAMSVAISDPPPPPTLQQRMEPTGEDARDLDEREVEVPSLQLQDVEGRIHKYEGPLNRRTKKAKLKHGWKKRWFRVTPG